MPNGCPVEYCEPGLICTSKDTDTECGTCVESKDFQCLMSLYNYFLLQIKLLHSKYLSKSKFIVLSGCHDTSPNCKQYANPNYCKTNDYVRKNCRKSCNLCSTY